MTEKMPCEVEMQFSRSEDVRALTIDANGIESNDVDPVIEYGQDEHNHYIHNGYGVYIIPKIAGERFVLRQWENDNWKIIL